MCRCGRTSAGTSALTWRSTATARETALTSAAADAPRSPRIVAGRPSFASAPAVSDGSSGWIDDRQAQGACLGQRRPQHRRVDARGGQVAEAHDPGRGQGGERTPASCPPGRPSPRRTAATGPATPSRPRPPAPAGRPPGRSTAGRVSAMLATNPKPPCAAAASPDANVSASSPPGSRMWARRSMNDGRDHHRRRRSGPPPARTPRSAPRPRPSSMASEPRPDRPDTGSTSQASSMLEVGRRRRRASRPSPGHRRSRPPAAPSRPCAPARRWRPGA